MLVIHPWIVYWLLRDFYEPSRPSLAKAYLPFITSGRVLGASGPMWFAVALLIFSLAYGFLRLASKRKPVRTVDAPLPSNTQVAGFALAMATAAFFVRLLQPVGSSVLNMQLANFAQYIAMFWLGIMAYRRNWLLRISYLFGMRWLTFTLLVGVPAWFILIANSGALQGDTSRLLGGWHWESALNCLWESFFCMGMSLGVLVLFRERFHAQTKLTNVMSRNAFSAYLFHTPLLIAVTLSLRPLLAPPFVKFVVASIIALPLTFLMSEFVFRRLPMLKRIL